MGSTLGNIYKARITNIEKSIGAAFVDFGHHRQGFLHVSDLSMAAVGEQSRSLLASVQAARETAHDEEIVEVGAAPDIEADASEAPAPVLDLDEADDEDELEAPEDSEAPLVEDIVRAGAGDGAAEGDDAEEEDEGPDQHESKKAESLAFARGDADWSEDDAPEAGAEGEEVEEEDDEDEAAPDEPAANGAAEEGDRSAVEQETSAGGEADDEGSGRAARGGRRGGRRRGRRGGRGREREQPRARPSFREMPPIQDILHKGQEIVVQVIKEGIGTKGPTLTTFLSIPGRFVVLMPGIAKRGVSRKVLDNAERERLKGIVRELKVPEELGFIVRTAGTGASRDDLQRDLDYLLRLWEQMATRVREYSAPVLLYQENDLVIRTLRDLYDGQGEVYVDDRPTMEKARQFMSEIMPTCVDKVLLYDGERPLFSHFNVEGEIEGLLNNRIELRSGGSLIIEQTEALVAIDVNSGRFKQQGNGSIDDTAYTVNAEAAVEIARQIRLRDLGGVVVIDFIDMRSERHRKAIEHQFKDELRRDRARIKVARFSPFGIIELTRQRVRPSLKRTVHQACPYCTGTGYIPSDETSGLAVVRKVHDQLGKPGGVIVVTVRPEVAEAVLNQQRRALLDMEERSRKSIFVRSDHRLSYEDVEVRAMVTLPDDIDHRRG